MVQEEPNYHGGKLSDYANAVGGTGDSYQQKKAAEMEKQVKDLKKQNTEMLTSNQQLKNRAETLKQQLDYAQA